MKKTIFITGSSEGIGLQKGKKFLSENFQVIKIQEKN